MLSENSDFSENLNISQREAVEAIDGRIRVVAGAGSGKTRVLAARYAYLVDTVGIDPANILCMTFTNKAAQEMKTRISKMLSTPGMVNDFVCTIHGFCVKVLRRDIYRLGFPTQFSIIDEDDAKQLARKVMDAIGLDRKKTTVKDVLASIARSKTMAATEYVARMLPGQPMTDDMFGRYIALQQKNFALDFNDLIFFTLYIFEHFADAREHWQNQLDYIEVDEVQDCNQSDWQIIDIVSARSGNLFIVGDPDQAIYEWRGANPSAFLNFAPDTDIILDRNYRSTPEILAVANSIIAHNRKRIPKNLHTKLRKGAKPLHLHAKGETAETEWVARRIKQLTEEEGAAYNHIAILMRASHTSRAFEQALIRHEIPYAVWGGVRFFDRKEIKDALSYLRLAANHADNLAFERIVNVPSRKFGKSTAEKLELLAEAEGKSLFDTLSDHISDRLFASEPLREFVYLINQLGMFKDDRPVADILDMALTDTGLREMYRLDSDESRLDNLAELTASIRAWQDEHREDTPTLDAYLQEIALYTDADYKRDEHKVRLMTIHQAKGLEFPYVFVVALTEGVFPSHRSIRERQRDGEEEERRLMYVACTRAERKLWLTESEGFGYGTGTAKYPSRFLSEIADGLVEVEGEIDPVLANGTRKLVRDLEIELKMAAEGEGFEPGTAVVHKLFGEGTVIENHPERGSCRVDFGDRKVNIRYEALTTQ